MTAIRPVQEIELWSIFIASWAKDKNGIVIIAIIGGN